MRQKRVLIVDDSATIRQIIRARVAQDPRLVVVGEAGDPYEAREKIKLLLPDVLTLDVEMPRMNGIAFLDKIMRLRPMPVIMISTLTHRGSAAAIEAMSLGAVDCVGKPISGDIGAAFADLPDKLFTAASANIRIRESVSRPPPREYFQWNGNYVLIGSSTGGVDALETVLASFPQNCPPTLIAQHMPPTFLESFARRLDTRIAPRLTLASEGAALLPGHVYLAPGGEYHLELDVGQPPRCHLRASEKVSGHRPSVDLLFASAKEIASRAVCVLLTGMGRDGAHGMGIMRKAGARCLAQDEATSVVYGMPKAAIETGAAEKALPLSEIAEEVLSICSQKKRVSAFGGSENATW